MSNTPSTIEPPSAGPIQILEPTPAVQLGLPATPPVWRTALDRRRAVVAAILTPVTVMLFLDAPSAGSVDQPWEWGALGLLGVLAALIWATFVPRQDGARTVAATPCGAMAAVYPVLALMSLGGQPMTPLMTGFSVLMLSYGLSQRVLGTGACRA